MKIKHVHVTPGSLETSIIVRPVPFKIKNSTVRRKYVVLHCLETTNVKMSDIP